MKNQNQNHLEEIKALMIKADIELFNFKETIKNTRMYMFKDIKKACGDAGVTWEQWNAIENELEFQFKNTVAVEHNFEHDRAMGVENL